MSRSSGLEKHYVATLMWKYIYGLYVTILRHVVSNGKRNDEI